VIVSATLQGAKCTFSIHPKKTRLHCLYECSSTCTHRHGTANYHCHVADNSCFIPNALVCSHGVLGLKIITKKGTFMNDRQCRPTNNKIVVRSRSHRCKGKATKSSLCIVEMHVTVKNTDIFDVAQRCFYGQFISPTNTNVLKSSCKFPVIFVTF
jgi:hypothetical protein